jgi:cytochrome c-type biogenesis protein CcmH/NrfF
MRTAISIIPGVLLLYLVVSFLPVFAQDSARPDLNAPKFLIINKVGPGDVLGDQFQPVKFRHKYHAQILKDCSVCHHFFEEHYNNQVVPADKCASCHQSDNFKNMSRSIRCDVCHNEDATPEVRYVKSQSGKMLLIPGLKAAFHRSCLGCHKEMGGPSTCGDCHLANVPDHSTLISDYKGAQTCEECHKGTTEQLLSSTHYKLSSPISYKFNKAKSGNDGISDAGMINRQARLWANNATEAWNADFKGACRICHAGYGQLPYSAKGEAEPSESDKSNIDCLVCHVSEDYSPVTQARLKADFSGLTRFAQKVNHTRTANCKRCHLALTSISADISISPVYSKLRGTIFEPAFDVHASIGLTCFDCHYDREHRFQRQVSASVQASDSPLVEQGCLRCHRDAHSADKYSKMAGFMACTGCHVPDKGGPIEINYENAGQPPQLRSKLVYKWFNRTTDFEGIPYGSKGNGMLYPFRMAVVREPLDADGKLIKVDPLSRKPVSSDVKSWRERKEFLPLSHGVSLQEAYTCSDCHGESPGFNWQEMGLKPPMFK